MPLLLETKNIETNNTGYPNIWAHDVCYYIVFGAKYAISLFIDFDFVCKAYVRILLALYLFIIENILLEEIIYLVIVFLEILFILIIII